MIAIIPVAGAGTRLRPHAYTQHKSLIPIAGKPLIGYIIDQLMNAGVDDFVFVIGYLGEKIREYIDFAYKDIRKSYVVQTIREGVGHAVWLANQVIEQDKEAIVMLGDTLIDIDIRKVMESPHSVLGVKKVADPRLFGVAEFGEDSIITSLSEKPKIPMSNMALVGLYMVKSYKKLYQALGYNIQNDIRTHNEFFLTDGLQRMIELGEVFRAEKIENWYDCGQKEVLLATNKMLLKKSAGKIKPHNHKNSVIIEPVFIGENVSIKDCVIGPNVTIGNQAVLEYAILRDCIVGNHTHIRDVALHHSLIGGDSKIYGTKHSLSVTDNTELEL